MSALAVLPLSLARPDPIAIILQIAGTEAAMIVAQRHGGRDIWLPVQPSDDHPLARLLGVRKAMQIVAALGPIQHGENGELGVSFLIPGNRRCISEDQARQALASSDERAAERLGVNEHTVAGWRMHFTGKGEDL